MHFFSTYKQAMSKVTMSIKEDTKQQAAEAQETKEEKKQRKQRESIQCDYKSDDGTQCPRRTYNKESCLCYIHQRKKVAADRKERMEIRMPMLGDGEIPCQLCLDEKSGKINVVYVTETGARVSVALPLEAFKTEQKK